MGLTHVSPIEVQVVWFKGIIMCHRVIWIFILISYGRFYIQGKIFKFLKFLRIKGTFVV